jgi:hypothetical protein
MEKFTLSKETDAEKNDIRTRLERKQQEQLKPIIGTRKNTE